MFSPPSSNEFGKFVEFVELLSNPKKLKENLTQFKNATSDFNKAAKELSDVKKIAKSVAIAEALRVSNEEEASRLKVLKKALDARDQESDTKMARNQKAIDKTNKEFTAEVERKRNEIDALARNTNLTLERREEAVGKREDEIVVAEGQLKNHTARLKQKEERIAEAFHA